jgi:hypothetical protein
VADQDPVVDQVAHLFLHHFEILACKKHGMSGFMYKINTIKIRY